MNRCLRLTSSSVYSSSLKTKAWQAPSVLFSMAEGVVGSSSELDFRNKVVLAPMVRMGTLPLRMLARQHGADMVWTEELIDRSVLNTERIVNDELGTIDFVRPLPELMSKKQQRTYDERGPQVIFRTCAAERPVVFQLGTANADLALQAAQRVAKDVSAIEVNMGCPKHFSLSGGMGAALLSAPENAKQILTTLKRNLSLPITCKIRMLSTVADTIDFCRMVQECGVSAITVHARNIAERPRDPARWKDLAPVFSAISVPTIANGDVFCFADIQRIKDETGCDSVMIGRGAYRNLDIWSDVEPIHPLIAMKEYLVTAQRWQNTWKNTKYALTRISGGGLTGGTPKFAPTLFQAKTAAEANALIDDELKTLKLYECYKRRATGGHSSSSSSSSSTASEEERAEKKAKLEK
mmetsp:Transcript_7896/g.24375  ORF Transcript_7896/g.24375 Transcript_7896/m.24375 type:complete len:409 (+) Transcript_7896:47-1273(+)